MTNCCSQMILELKVESVKEVTQHIEHCYPVFNGEFAAATQLTKNTTKHESSFKSHFLTGTYV